MPAEFELALLFLQSTLGCSFCRNPNMEEDDGYFEEEDDREEDDRWQPLLALWRGANRYILAGNLISLKGWTFRFS